MLFRLRIFLQMIRRFYAGNLKYSCIRYVPVNLSKTQSKVWWTLVVEKLLMELFLSDMSIAKTIASQRFVQTAQVDERMRGIQLSEEALLEGYPALCGS